MGKSFLVPSHGTDIEHNVYADKSALVIDWLLLEGIHRKQFAIREVVRERNISIGLTQKIFTTLTQKGYLKTVGQRTAKKFILKKPELLLKSWLEHYSIVKKCKMWPYRTGLQNREHIIRVLIESNLSDKVVLALHSAAEVHGCKNTNLQTVELYVMDPIMQSQIEEKLLLEPQERGYEVLLINPYYKSILALYTQMQRCSYRSKEGLPTSSPLLTFLDLYHFPLRGREQAEFMAERTSELKQIYKNRR